MSVVVSNLVVVCVAKMHIYSHLLNSLFSVRIIATVINSEKCILIFLENNFSSFIEVVICDLFNLFIQHQTSL